MGPEGTLRRYDGFDRAAPIGSLQANPFGLHDVLGNVHEWCRDVLGSYEWPVAPGDALRLVPEGEGDRRVYRGGAWNDRLELARSAGRAASAPDASLRGWHVGLRPVRALDR